MYSPTKNCELIVFGRASQRIVFQRKLPLKADGELLLSLMARHGINLASACQGQGICQKCSVWYVGKKILACQHTADSLSRALNEQNDDHRLALEVDYL
ncbi:MAG: hypothetical protein A2X86_19850 [Bdellovibrionales bacterium GWA2_49_15]|nr:MAG: hypothetical protein A2X86_19850 [Bdellovibrionales bacterium GWA2_49_15]